MTTSSAHIANLAELAPFARRLADSLAPGTVYLMRGDLGAGKTTLVREICAALGVPEARVVSPTFTLIQEYEGGRLPVVHIDLYRIDPGKPLDTLFLEEIFARRDCVTFLEWPDAALRLLPPGTTELRIDFGAAPEERLITMSDGPTR